MRPAVLLVALGVIGACGPTPENWSKKSAKATCDFQKRCATANFWTQWADKQACETANELALNEEALAKVDCVFDDAQAGACLDALKSSCKNAGEGAELLFEPCYHVYNCGTEPVDTATEF